MTKITADFLTLLDQASGTANRYMRDAVEDIDKLFGNGYASKNPVIVAAYMQTAAIDMGSATMAKVVGEAIEVLASATMTSRR